MSAELTTGTNISEQTFDFGTTQELKQLPDKPQDGEIASVMWNVPTTLIKEIGNMTRVYGSKHGMFASVPIICRGDKCSYKDICMVSQANRKIGQRCPMEIATILARYEQYCRHFDISSEDDVIDDKDLVDATLIKDLVTIEVQQLRAENKLAMNGDFMSATLLDIDKKCNPYFGEIVSPEMEFLMTLQDKKVKILNQLNSTRKDKAADKRRENASDEAIKIFQQIREMEKQEQKVDISDIEFDEDGNIVQEEPEIDIADQILSGIGNENTKNSPDFDENDAKNQELYQKIHDLKENNGGIGFILGPEAENDQEEAF